MNHANCKDITGRRFGKWIVLSRAGSAMGSGNALWECVCDCGTRRAVKGARLRSGNSSSCGCDVALRARNQMTTHGQSRTRLYRTYRSMINRCENPKTFAYQDYGGRGIKVCHKWRESFAQFIADMGPRPLGATIERIDNDGGYSASNCKWSTPLEQGQNKRNSRKVSFGGQTLTLRDWAAKTGIPISCLRERHRHRWTPERMLTTPPQLRSV